MKPQELLRLAVYLVNGPVGSLAGLSTSIPLLLLFNGVCPCAGCLKIACRLVRFVFPVCADVVCVVGSLGEALLCHFLLRSVHLIRQVSCKS